MPKNSKPDVIEIFLQATGLNNDEIFRGRDGSTYATVVRHNRSETIELESEEFENWVIVEVYKAVKKSLSKEQIQTIIRHFRAHSSEQKSKEVFRRVGGTNEHFLIDLTDEDGNFVEVSKDGWKVVSSLNVPIKFRRTSNCEPLPLPTGDISTEEAMQELAKFFTLDAGQQRLLLASLLSFMLPYGPFPVLVLNGERGSGKTTMAEVIKELVDPPGFGDLQTYPSKVDDYYVSGTHCWVMATDNLPPIDEELSNAMCTISTGSSYSKRKLYTDKHLVRLRLQQPQIVTGIETLACRGDLVDRAVILQPTPMQAAVSRNKESLKSFLHDLKPALFKALLDLHVEILKIKLPINVQGNVRMAGFMRCGLALDQILWKPGDFIQELQTMRGSSELDVLESTIIGDHFVDFVTNTLNADETTSRSSTEWLAHFETFLGSTPITLSRYFPKTPIQFSNQLKKLAPVLRSQKNVVVEFSRKHEGRRISIRWTDRRPPEPTIMEGIVGRFVTKWLVVDVQRYEELAAMQEVYGMVDAQ